MEVSISLRVIRIPVLEVVAILGPIFETQQLRSCGVATPGLSEPCLALPELYNVVQISCRDHLLQQPGLTTVAVSALDAAAVRISRKKDANVSCSLTGLIKMNRSEPILECGTPLPDLRETVSSTQCNSIGQYSHSMQVATVAA